MTQISKAERLKSIIEIQTNEFLATLVRKEIRTIAVQKLNEFNSHNCRSSHKPQPIPSFTRKHGRTPGSAISVTFNAVDGISIHEKLRSNSEKARIVKSIDEEHFSKKALDKLDKTKLVNKIMENKYIKSNSININDVEQIVDKYVEKVMNIIMT